MRPSSPSQLHIDTLLVRALHARLIVIFVHRVLSRRTFPLPLVDLVQLDFLEMYAWRELLNRYAWRECLLEKGDNLGVNAVGELDGDLDEQVSRFVVSL